jgi:hypothetical protein
MLFIIVLPAGIWGGFGRALARPVRAAGPIRSPGSAA